MKILSQLADANGLVFNIKLYTKEIGKLLYYLIWPHMKTLKSWKRGGSQTNAYHIGLVAWNMEALEDTSKVLEEKSQAMGLKT